MIELGRTNKWVEYRPWELPCPCRVSRLTQQVSSDGVGRGRAPSPSASQVTGILQLIAQARFLHWGLLRETR